MSEKLSNKYLICGLGNPGKDYENTRHNIGFRVLEALAEKWSSSFSYKKRLKADISYIKTEEKELVLCKPQTFMNVSGEALKKTLHFYKIPTKQALIVYDDIDIPFKQFRYRASGSAGTHNGLKSILEYLHSNKIPRLRIGIGMPPTHYPLDRYVLSPFNQTEIISLDAIIKESIKTIVLFIEETQTKLMNQYTKSLVTY